MRYVLDLRHLSQEDVHLLLHLGLNQQQPVLLLSYPQRQDAHHHQTWQQCSLVYQHSNRDLRVQVLSLQQLHLLQYVPQIRIDLTSSQYFWLSFIIYHPQFFSIVKLARENSIRSTSLSAFPALMATKPSGEVTLNPVSVLR